MQLPTLVGMAMVYITGTEFYYSCTWILDANCTNFTQAHTCGTDNVTYINKCDFSQAHCNDTNVHLLHPGACNSIEFPTPPLPSHGAEVVFDFFCTVLSHISCKTTGVNVCGSDGRTYSNKCEFMKSKCTHRDLHVANIGDCAA